MSFSLFQSWDFPDKTSKEINFQEYFTTLKDPSLRWDIVQLGADFYLGFAIINKSLVKFPQINLVHPNEVAESARILKLSDEEIEERNEKYYTYMKINPVARLQKILDDFEPWYLNKIREIDLLFIDYSSAAIGGEIRHHKNIIDLGKGASTEARHIAWSRWCRIHEIYGDDIFETAEKLFLDFELGSYGGPPWANAANLLLKRKRMQLAGNVFENQTLFIDRVFNMQHNTGSFLNKLNWANLREDDGDGIHNIHQTVLAAHSANPPNISLLLSKSSDYVRSTATNILNIAKYYDLEINGTID